MITLRGEERSVRGRAIQDGSHRIPDTTFGALATDRLLDTTTCGTNALSLNSLTSNASSRIPPPLVRLVRTRLPQDGVQRAPAFCVRSAPADDLPPRVDGQGNGVGAAEGAQ